MKKILLILLITLGCVNDDHLDIPTINLNSIGNMFIFKPTGLKFEGSNITNGSKFNLKVLEAGKYTIEVRDPFKNLTSKSIIDAKAGDNVLKFYTRALRDGDYNIIVSKGEIVSHNVKLVIK